MQSQKKKRNVIFILLSLIAVFSVSLFLFMQSPMFDVQLSQDEISLEIGHSIEKSPSYYLEGNAFSVALSFVDASSVQKNEAGRYPIIIYHGFEQYTCYVTVMDTEPPVISCDINTKTVLPGETISIEKLGVRTKDFSEIESVAFTKIASTHFYTGLPDEETEQMRAAYEKGINFYGEEFQFAYGGVYTLTVEACDIFQNRSEITLTLKVEEPPIIEAPSDFYIATGSEIDFAEHVLAWDFIDEDFSMENVEVDSSSVSLGTAGNYTITFTGTDSYGLTAAVTSTVHILSKEDLQELINTHKINISEHVIVGAYNAYDLGYYDNQSLEATRSAQLPATVHVKNLRDDTFGSGFIIHIDEEAVTIATCYHVTEQCVTPRITFDDGTTRLGAVVGQNKESDVAFIQIPIDGSSEKTSLPSDYVKNLRTVHIDEAYWKSIPNDSSLLLGYVCIDGNGYIRDYSKGTLLTKDVKKDWNDYEDVHQMLISMDPKPGSSGSALFDETGRLIGMVRGHSKYKDGSTVKVGVPLSEILRLYELTFKEKLQYQ